MAKPTPRIIFKAADTHWRVAVKVTWDTTNDVFPYRVWAKTGPGAEWQYVNGFSDMKAGLAAAARMYATLILI